MNYFPRLVTGGGSTVVAPVPLDPAFDPYAITSNYLFDSRYLTRIVSGVQQQYLWKDIAGTSPVTTDGDAVLNFTDFNNSGSAHAATDTVGAVYKTTGGASSLPYVLFNGTTQKLRVTQSVANTYAQPYTILLVVRQPTVVASSAIFSSSDPAANRFLLSNPASGTAMVINAGNSAGLPSGTSGTTLQRWQIIIDGASSSVSINGVLVASGNYGAQSMNGLTIAANRNGTTTNPCNLEFYFGAVFPGHFSATQMTKSATWMTRTWS